MTNSVISIEEAKLYNRVCGWLAHQKGEASKKQAEAHHYESQVVVSPKPAKVRSPAVFSPDGWVHAPGQRWLRSALHGMDVNDKERQQERVSDSHPGIDSAVSLLFDEAGSDSQKKTLRARGKRVLGRVG